MDVMASLIISKKTKTLIEASIEWKSDIPFSKSGKKREICKWKQNNSYSYFDLILKYDFIANSLDERGKSGQSYFELFLKQIKSPAQLSDLNDVDWDCQPMFFNNEEFTDEEKESKLSFWDRLSAVRATLLGKTITLKKSKSNEWKSERFVLDVESEPSSHSTETMCVLRIQYEHFNRGESCLLKNLEDLYVKQIQCDIQFCFDDDAAVESDMDDENDFGDESDIGDESDMGDESEVDDENDVGGHIAILTARSPVFAAMFNHQMEETKTGRVTIKDVQKDIFKELLHYIYLGRTEMPLTEKTAQPLFEAANKYDIEVLKEECVDFLLTCIRLKNAITLLIWAHFHSIDRLKDAILKFITEHGRQICEQDDWKMLVENHHDLTLMATRLMIK